MAACSPGQLPYAIAGMHTASTGAGSCFKWASTQTGLTGVDYLEGHCLARTSMGPPPMVQEVSEVCEVTPVHWSLVQKPWMAGPEHYAAASTVFAALLAAMCVVWGVKRIFRIFERPTDA